MAEKKKGTQKSSADVKKSATNKPVASSKPKDDPDERIRKKYSSEEVEATKRRKQQFVPFVLVIAAILITISYIFVEKSAIFGAVVQTVFYGLFGHGAFAIPVFLIIAAFNWMKYVDKKAIRLNVLLLVLVLIFISSFSEVIILAINRVDPGNWSISIKTLFNEGKELRNGGVIGGLAGILFWNVFGQIPSFIIIISIVIIMALSVCGATPVTVVTYIRYKMKKKSEQNADKKSEKAAEKRARKEEKRNEALIAREQKEREAARIREERRQKEAEVLATEESVRVVSAPAKKDESGEAVATKSEPIVEISSPAKAEKKTKPKDKDIPEFVPLDIGLAEDTGKGDGTKQESASDDASRVGILADVPAEDATSHTATSDSSVPNITINRYNMDGDSVGLDIDLNGASTEIPQMFPPVRGKTRPAKSSPDMAVIANESGDDGSEFQNTLDVGGDANTTGQYVRNVQMVFDDIPEVHTADETGEKEETAPTSKKKLDDIDDIDDIIANIRRSLSEKKKEDELAARTSAVVIGTEDAAAKADDDSSGDVDPVCVETESDILKPDPYVDYVFPPTDLLAPPTADGEISDAEIRENVERLMETLKSFKIGVSDITCSCGPTITRYEVKPEAGVRVRAIANLVDDIALGLAKSGVRIEAPIPGKSAVGIEVPNDNKRTVYLRQLIEHKVFTEMKSKISSCLGADVSGNPIAFDIMKMPHLLIAGATGMGKSVCINSIIVSLLYKAKPDEVKLILIDPKKVEFGIYKDIPHLYVPIVSNPKKAAGALASAVAEMERRFAIMEEIGVRDIAKYNEITKDDPDMEFMPKIVIIIDELADLMMTAPDEVETSICRITQKARAAGIHLIIGTQRPSVDVITGLIKANIPSRIAFTVASQVDSRTIIDIAGAEKLIGRGDMLYAPVGAAKPMRVQGSFVSENEVEAICNFIRKHNGKAIYNEQFTKQIDQEAEKCGMPKKSPGASSYSSDDSDMGDEDGDSKLREAIEIAVTDQKISTSLLQRKLSIGYGRAAKIIDRMQEMNIVSPPDGNKPRKILITKEQYMEMYLNDDI